MEASTMQGNDHMKSPRYEDPSAKIWNIFLSESEKSDKALSLNWKADMDSILIYAGLFSASVTAFLVESYRRLLPDTDDQTVFLLSQISLQLNALSNGVPITVDALPTSQSFTPPLSAMTCNIFWYLSLSFSLLCALFATLVQQWTRHYITATDRHSTPQRRARVSAFRYDGLLRFQMKAVVEVIPFLLHLSLFFFFAGLVAYLIPINEIVAYLILGILSLCVVLYTLVTFLPVLCHECPYRTPLSPLTWNILCALRLLHHRDVTGMKRKVPSQMAMNEAREVTAIEISPERDERDFSAMRWALQSIHSDSDLESFVEVIPKVVACTDYSAKLLLYRLMEHEAVTVRLGYRISRLLMTCTDKQLRVEKGLAQKRATACSSAIWSLTMMSLSGAKLSTPSTVYFSRQTLRFDEQTLRNIATIDTEVQGISKYTVSARSVVARTLLDMHLDQLLKLELEIHNFVRTRRWSDERTEKWDLHKAHMHSQLALKWLSPQLSELEDLLASLEFNTNLSNVFQTLDRSRQLVEDLVHAAAASNDIRFIEGLFHDIVNYIVVLRGHLKQAGFFLTIEFLSNIVRNQHDPPYEAANTLRRLFLRVNPDHDSFSITSQASFTAVLDDALSAEVRLPERIANILLGILVRRVLTHPSSVVKAKAIIFRYIQVSRFDAANEAAWLKAIEVLDTVVQGDVKTPILDIFRFHMYTNTKAGTAHKLL